MSPICLAARAEEKRAMKRRAMFAKPSRATSSYCVKPDSRYRIRFQQLRSFMLPNLANVQVLTAGLHKIARPGFKRRGRRIAEAGISAFALMQDDDTNMRALPDDGPKINYGTDIPTLAERIESGRF